MSRIRPITPADGEALAELVIRNRAFLAPYEPFRPEEFFSVAGQRAAIEAITPAVERGEAAPFVILDDDGAVAGRITLTSIARGPLMSCVMGYFLSEDRTGRGLVTEAVAEVLTYAFVDLGLHRVEAGTLIHNTASQRVLQRSGFVQYGMAPRYLKIDGRWQDHLLFQRLADEE